MSHLLLTDLLAKLENDDHVPITLYNSITAEISSIFNHFQTDFQRKLSSLKGNKLLDSVREFRQNAEINAQSQAVKELKGQEFRMPPFNQAYQFCPSSKCKMPDKADLSIQFNYFDDIGIIPEQPDSYSYRKLAETSLRRSTLTRKISKYNSAREFNETQLKISGMNSSASGSLKVPSGLVPPPPLLSSLFEKLDDQSFISRDSDTRYEASRQKLESKRSVLTSRGRKSNDNTLESPGTIAFCSQSTSISLQANLVPQNGLVPTPPPPPPQVSHISNVHANRSNTSKQHSESLNQNPTYNRGQSASADVESIPTPPPPPLLSSMSGPPPPQVIPDTKVSSDNSRSQLLDAIRNAGVMKLKKTPYKPDCNSQIVSDEPTSFVQNQKIDSKDSRGQILDSIRNAGLSTLKKTSYATDSNPKITSIEDKNIPLKDNSITFQSEILSKKLSPAKNRNIGHRVLQEPSRPTFESQLFEKIRKRALIVDNQIINDEKGRPHNLLADKNINIVEITGTTSDGLKATKLNDYSERYDGAKVEVLQSRVHDSDNISLNSSKLSVLEVSQEMFATVLHDFHPNTAGQLGFNKGDRLIIIDWNFSEGWAHVTTIDGKSVGIFPKVLIDHA